MRNLTVNEAMKLTKKEKLAILRKTRGLTVKETARLIMNVKTGTPGVSPGRVRQLITSGQLDAYQFGRDWAIPTEEIERFNSLSRAEGRPGHKKHLDVEII